jgi:hypothetical protein
VFEAVLNFRIFQNETIYKGKGRKDMKNVRISLFRGLFCLSFLVLAAQLASADSIVFVGQYDITGAGFGNHPRALTIQSHSPSNPTESGCIAPDGGGGLIEGSSACANTAVTVGGNEDNPLGFPKQAAPTVASLGIVSGTQLGILFDGIQPQNAHNDFVTINDLTLKLYNGSQLIYSVSGTFNPLDTNPGNGNTDYQFGLDAAAAAAFDAALSGNLTDRIALDSTISFPRGSSGPDSYLLIDNGAPVPPPPPPPVPEPMSLLLFGSGFAVMLAKKGLRKS